VQFGDSSRWRHRAERELTTTIASSTSAEPALDSDEARAVFVFKPIFLTQLAFELAGELSGSLTIAQALTLQELADEVRS